MNDTSSRSHALVKIHVEITRSDATALTSMLTLVDLAGSEKWNTSIEMASAQEKELTHINSSLSTLSNCIRCLVSGDTVKSQRIDSRPSLCRRDFGI